MARARGITAELLAGFQSNFDTVAGSGEYWKLPFYSETVGETQGLEEDPELGLGREPQAPSRGARDVDGEIVVPGRLVPLGVWLKALLGAPTTTGTDPDFTHTYTSGKADLPILTLEKKLLSNAFLQERGVKANTMGVSLERSGSPRFTFGLLGAEETKLTSSAAGSPTELTSPKVHNFQGTIKKDGSDLANVTGVDLNWANGLEAVPTVANSGVVSGIDEGLPSLTGSLTARFADFTLYDAAADDTTMSLELAWTISASRLLKLTMHRVRLPKVKHEIPGPGGIEVSYDWRGEKDSGAGVSLTVELQNSQSGYTLP